MTNLRYFFYSAIIDDTSNFFKVKGYEVSANNSISGGSGISFTSKYQALLKCLCECIERFCNLRFNRIDILYSAYSNLRKNSLDTYIYINNSEIREKKLGWINGVDFLDNKSCYLPAQLIYLGYPIKKEVRLTSSISTGAAGGFDHETTLLRGIYEIIERDAFMTIYLNKISAKRIDIDKIKNKTIQKILDKCQRYNLELYLFDITNDIEIPSFLTLVIDRQGIGPAIVAGLKSGLNTTEAIIGSLEESLLCRFWLRYEVFKRKSKDFKIDPNKITSTMQRGLYWYPTQMLEKLDFLLRQNPVLIQISNSLSSPKNQLNYIRTIFLKKRIRIFYKDITIDNFRRLGYLIYKVVIPELQPLYLNENEKEIKINRLKKVSLYFGQKDFHINDIPHFFL